MKIAQLPILAFAIWLTLSCKSADERTDERYDVGYNDGYATGYNTACEIRATLIEGDFKNKHYAEGYRVGYSAGVTQCNAERD